MVSVSDLLFLRWTHIKTLLVHKQGIGRTLVKASATNLPDGIYMPIVDSSLQAMVGQNTLCDRGNTDFGFLHSTLAICVDSKKLSPCHSFMSHSRFLIQVSSLLAVAKATYSVSVYDCATWVCLLLIQRNGVINSVNDPGSRSKSQLISGIIGVGISV